jgi:streptogramin lyase
MRRPPAVRTLAVLLAIAAVALLAPVAASAAPAVDGEFAVSGVGTNNELALGPDGNMWVTLDVGNDLAKITPTGQVTEYNPADVTSPIGIITGPDGNLWVTQPGGVARFSAADPNAAVKFAIADITDPRGITVGLDGNLWTASAGNVIKFSPANPLGATSFPVIAGARDIATGGDGDLWVADFGGAAVVSVTTAGAATPYPVSGGPQAIAAGPAGQIAYSDPNANPQEIGRVVAGGTPLKTQTPMMDPFGVALGEDRAYWIANFASNDLGRLTTTGAFSTLTGFSAAAGPRRIAAGPPGSGTLWVTLDLAEKVARITGVDAPSPPPPPPDDDPPEVSIDKQPDKSVEAKGKRAKVKFKFSSPTADATFECKLKKKKKKKNGGKSAQPAAAKFEVCESPQKYKLKPGKYTFSVRALSGDLTGEAESAKFKVRRAG